MKTLDVAPSLLAANFSCLKDEILLAEKSGAKYLHIDVMDGHFVPNISIGVPAVKSISNIHSMINDVHIMISDPRKYATKFIDAGADILTFHYEALTNDDEVKEIIDIIKNNNCKVGLSIKPKTPVELILPFVKDVDLVLIMSVEPGFGGQSFIPLALDKIATLRQYIASNKLKTLIEVDGGINETTAKQVKLAGADIVVAGSYLFGHEDFKERLESLR